MNQGYPQQPQQPKKGMSTLAIVLIVLGVLLVLFLGTCAAGALWFTHEVKEVEKNLGEGGLVLASPPDVISALGGAKKDYVGAWTSKSGRSTMTIAPNGEIHLKLNEGESKEEITAPIAAFIGDDIDIKVGLELRIKVTSAPHQSGSKWAMTAKNIDWER